MKTGLQQERWFTAYCFFLTTCFLATSIIIRPIRADCVHEQKTEDRAWRVVTGWGMSSFMKHRTENTWDRMTYKGHYKEFQEFLFVKTHIQEESEQRKEESWFWFYTLLHLNVLWGMFQLCMKALDEYYYISFSNLNWQPSCYCTVEAFGFFVVVKYDVDFWVVLRNVWMILSSIKTRARPCTNFLLVL